MMYAYNGWLKKVKEILNERIFWLVDNQNGKMNSLSGWEDTSQKTFLFNLEKFLLKLMMTTINPTEVWSVTKLFSLAVKLG